MVRASLPRGRLSYGLLLLAVLVAVSSAACDYLLPRGPLDRARERNKQVSAVLWTEPILEPPPGATVLLRYGHPPSFVNARARVKVIYASAQSMEEVEAWYSDRFGTHYGLTFPPPNGLGAVLTVGQPKGKSGIAVAVSLQAKPPDVSPDVKLKPAPPGTKTYIEVGASET